MTFVPNSPSGLVFFAHGSRDPLWRKPIDAIVLRAQEMAPDTLVRSAYLELTEPSLRDCVAEMAGQGVRSVKVVPLFLGVGRHAREDLPVLMAELKTLYPQVGFILDPPIGEDQRLINLVAKIAIYSNEH